MTDFSVNYPSDSEYYNAQPSSTPALVYFTQKYLSDPADAANPLASPLRAHLAGLPSTTIIAAEIDPLRDEGKAYADALSAAGVNVDYKLYPAVTHEFFGMGAVLDAARDAEALAGADLRRAFAR